MHFAKSIGILHKNFGILDIKVCAKCRVQKISHVNVNHNRGPNMSADGPSNCTKIFHIANKNCATCTFVKLHNKELLKTFVQNAQMAFCTKNKGDFYPPGSSVMSAYIA